MPRRPHGAGDMKRFGSREERQIADLVAVSSLSNLVDASDLSLTDFTVVNLEYFHVLLHVQPILVHTDDCL